MDNKETKPVIPERFYPKELQQKRLPRHAAFSGGGAKGVVYCGVHEELYNSGLLADMIGVAGSSAGSITSAAIASGITPEAFKKLNEETDMRNLLGKGGVDLGPAGVWKEGKPLRNLMGRTMLDNAKAYLNNEFDFAEVKQERLASITLKEAELSQEQGALKQIIDHLKDYDKQLPLLKQQLIQKQNEAKDANLDAKKKQDLALQIAN